MKLSLTAKNSSPFKRVSTRIISTTFTSQPTLSSMEMPIWAGFHNREPRRFTDAVPEDVCKAPGRSRLGRSLTSQAVPQTYQNTKLLRLLDFEMRWVNRSRGVSEPNVWLYSLSWITIQELGLKAVFNETTHCVLLHSLSSFTLFRSSSPTQYHQPFTWSLPSRLTYNYSNHLKL